MGSTNTGGGSVVLAVGVVSLILILTLTAWDRSNYQKELQIREVEQEENLAKYLEALGKEKPTETDFFRLGGFHVLYGDSLGYRRHLEDLALSHGWMSEMESAAFWKRISGHLELMSQFRREPETTMDTYREQGQPIEVLEFLQDREAFVKKCPELPLGLIVIEDIKRDPPSKPRSPIARDYLFIFLALYLPVQLIRSTVWSVRTLHRQNRQTPLGPRS